MYKFVSYCLLLGAVLTASTIYSQRNLPAKVTLSSTASNVIQPQILGLGFNTKTHELWSESQWQQIQHALEQTRPGYMRLAFNIEMFSTKPGERIWSSAQHRRLYEYLRFLKTLGTKVQLYLHHEHNPAYVGGGYGQMTSAQVNDYARLYADVLEHLVRRERLDNIVGWAPSNEMSTRDGWGFYYFGNDQVPPSAAQAAYLQLTQKVQQTLQSRGLGAIALRIGEMRADGPLTWSNGVINTHPLLKDAVISMHFYASDQDGNSDITGARILPGVTEQNYTDLASTRNFTQFLQHFRTYIPPERSLIVGEFGGLTVDDWETRRAYYRDGNSRRFGLHIAERTVQFLQQGFQGVAKWTLEDLDFQSPNALIYQHGTLALTSDKNFVPRADYYSYGLLTRSIPVGAKTHPLVSETDAVHGIAASFTSAGRSQVTIALVNRNPVETPVSLRLQYPALSERTNRICRLRYQVTPDAPRQEQGYQMPLGQQVSHQAGIIEDIAPPNSLTVYTTRYSVSGRNQCV